MAAFHRVTIVGALMCVLFAPQRSFGQGTEFSLGASGLIAIQPVEDDYVGRGPYLSGPGLGGLGPGFSAAFNVVTERHLAVTVEYSTAYFEAERSGRVVPGPCPPNVPSNECSSVGGTGTAEINDSMLGGLVGYAMRSGGTQAHFMGGAYWRLDEPTVGGTKLSETGLTDRRGVLRVAIGGGLDVVQRVAAAAALVVGARYMYVADEDRRGYFGISPHVLRVSLGLRFRLN